MNTYVFYHANCNDGFGAAWAAFKRFGWDAKYKPCSYGKPLPKRSVTSGCRIYFVDMSTTPEILDDLAKDNEVIILDHHDTAEAALSKYERLPVEYNYNWDNGREIKPGVSVRFDMEKSGAMLAWEYFQPGIGVPQMIRYIQDRDLWLKQLRGHEEVNAVLSSYKKRFDEYEAFYEELETNLDGVIDQGVGILRARNQISQQIGSSHRVIEWGGHSVAIVNCTTMWSDVCNDLIQLYTPEKDDKGNWKSWVRLDSNGDPIHIDYVIAYSFHSRGSRFMMSLRSKGDFRVNDIAAQFGGGGHPNAAGANITAEEGMELIKEWGLLTPLPRN